MLALLLSWSLCRLPSFLAVSAPAPHSFLANLAVAARRVAAAFALTLLVAATLAFVFLRMAVAFVPGLLAVAPLVAAVLRDMAPVVPPFLLPSLAAYLSSSASLRPFAACGTSSVLFVHFTLLVSSSLSPLPRVVVPRTSRLIPISAAVPLPTLLIPQPFPFHNPLSSHSA